MTAVTAWPIRHPFTVDDLADMPDDGKRYELIDGILLVTPSPSFTHQGVSMALSVALSTACPPPLRVLAAPLDLQLADDTVVQPDLMVLDHRDVERHGPRSRPLLVVEILSPSTRLVDLNLKKARYEVAGCPLYWAVDPGLRAGEPSITAWEWRDGTYHEVGHAEGDEIFSARLPFAVDIVPSQLATP